MASLLVEMYFNKGHGSTLARTFLRAMFTRATVKVPLPALAAAVLRSSIRMFGDMRRS
jgi:hypothetical protein